MDRRLRRRCNKYAKQKECNPVVQSSCSDGFHGKLEHFNYRMFSYEYRIDWRNLKKFTFFIRSEYSMAKTKYFLIFTSV